MPDTFTESGGADKEEFGLYEKYEVYEDGERVENCFVVEPQSDEAARAAIRKYASETWDSALADDLRE